MEEVTTWICNCQVGLVVGRPSAEKKGLWRPNPFHVQTKLWEGRVLHLRLVGFHDFPFYQVVSVVSISSPMLRHNWTLQTTIGL